MCSTINKDLAKERNTATIDVNEFSIYFYGGEDNLKLRRLINKEIYEDLKDPLEYEYQSYENACETAVKNTISIATKVRNLQARIGLNNRDIYSEVLSDEFNSSSTVQAGNPFSISVLMFNKALKNQATTELYEQFGVRAERGEIIGTFAQTELGHGTYIRGLETRADYDHSTDEFILNTPTLTAYKWWPGGMSHIANYCIVVAQLYIENESKGVQLFLVQLRDEKTHAPLPGIELGDIGKRISLLGVHNGYLAMRNVRIPRTQMLMRNACVTSDGYFKKLGSAHMVYFPMMYVRCGITNFIAVLLLQAVTIVTRYSAVRRQSPIDPNDPEPQILDHLTQKLKLFPELAAGMAYHIVSLYMTRFYETSAVAVTSGDYSCLPELHLLACVMKAISSQNGAQGIERLRMACGGHGYLMAANIGNIYARAAAACTFEGENTVLLLQAGRSLMKVWHDLQARKSIMPCVQYMRVFATLMKFPKWTGSCGCLVQALQYVTTNKVKLTFKRLKNRMMNGESQATALNHTGIELKQVAELFGHTFLAKIYHDEVTGSSARLRSKELNQVLEQLLEIHLICTVQNFMGEILRFISLTENDLEHLQSRLEGLLNDLRPNAVALCDGFDFPDKELCSVLGCYDGNVYERIFESAQKSPLNKKTIMKSFHKYLQPFMQRSKL